MKLEYRSADLSDAERIFQMGRDTIERYEDTEAIDYERVLAWVRRKIEKYVGEYTWVFCDGEKAGYYRICPKNEKLDALYIFPAVQNRGIGTAVLSRGMEEADLPILLYVFARNTRAMALYRRMGFQVTERGGKTRCIMEYSAV